MKELDLPPETAREKYDREMKEMSDRQTQGIRDRRAAQSAKNEKDIAAILEAYPNKTRAEAIEMIQDAEEKKYRYRKKKKKKDWYQKSTKGTLMKSGGKVYARGSRKANYNG
jgi:hypothetical protein